MNIEQNWSWGHSFLKMLERNWSRRFFCQLRSPALNIKYPKVRRTKKVIQRNELFRLQNPKPGYFGELHTKSNCLIGSTNKCSSITYVVYVRVVQLLHSCGPPFKIIRVCGPQPAKHTYFRPKIRVFSKKKKGLQLESISEIPIFVPKS